MLSTLLRTKERSMCKLSYHRRRYPLNYSIGVPSVPTTNQLVALLTTDLPVQRLVTVWSTACTVQKSTVVVNTREEYTCCLECCQSDDPRTCSAKRAIEPRTTIHIVINDDRHLSRTF